MRFAAKNSTVRENLKKKKFSSNSSVTQGKDRRYAELDSGLLPKTESLADTVERFLPYWHDTIAPAIKSGKRVIVAAHGNRFALSFRSPVVCVCARQSSFCRFDRRSLRALVKAGILKVLLFNI
jgi:hypothetical protein